MPIRCKKCDAEFEARYTIEIKECAYCTPLKTGCCRRPVPPKDDPSRTKTKER